MGEKKESRTTSLFLTELWVGATNNGNKKKKMRKRGWGLNPASEVLLENQVEEFSRQ